MVYLDKGYIGFFDMSCKDSGKREMERYVSQLKDAGHKRIIAPINGDTWRRYRLVSWSGGAPLFPLEPHNPLWYNEVYEELGFKPLKKYSSDKFSLGGAAPTWDEDASLSIRDYQEGDLKLIYDISLNGFDENFLYSGISFEDFSALYQPILPMIDKELVAIAEYSGAPVGFIFALAAGGTLILKTVAVLQEHRGKGIAAKLVNHALSAGRRKGAETAIAALIAQGNNSHKIITKYNSEQIREYTLYCLEV